MNQRTDMTPDCLLCSALNAVLSALSCCLELDLEFGTVFWVGFMLFFLSSFPGRVRSSEVPGSSGLGLGTWD